MARSTETQAATDIDDEQAEIDRRVEAQVNARIDALLPVLFERMVGVQRQIGAAGQPGDDSMAKLLAYEIAKLGGQETGRVFVDPVELEQRAHARKELGELLVEMQVRAREWDREHPQGGDNPHIPTYTLTSKVQVIIYNELGQALPVLMEPFYLDDNKRQRPTVVDSLGIPNTAMAPSNDAARLVHTKFMASIGGEAPTDPRTGALIADPDRDMGQMAFRNGVVVRGSAASSILRNTKGQDLREAVSSGMGVHVRRGDGETRKVNVLGSLTPAIEVR
jgi:hypothetical protein